MGDFFSNVRYLAVYFFYVADDEEKTFVVKHRTYKQLFFL